MGFDNLFYESEPKSCATDFPRFGVIDAKEFIKELRNRLGWNAHSVVGDVDVNRFSCIARPDGYRPAVGGKFDCVGEQIRKYLTYSILVNTNRRE